MLFHLAGDPRFLFYDVLYAVRMASCGNLRYGGVVLTHIFCGHDP